MVETTDFADVEQLVVYLIHLRAYEEAARLGQNKSILDVGCNNGYGIEVMKRLGCSRVAGMDVSPDALRSARQRLGLEAELYLYDGKKLPIESGTFDIITSFQCIEHIQDCDRYLSEIRQLLKPGGTAIFTTPNASIRLDPGMKPWNEFHVREYSHTEFANQLAGHFSTVEIRGLFGTDPVQSVEINRCAKAREHARRGTPPKNYKAAVLRGIRKIVPTPVVNLIKRGALQAKPARLPTYTTADLFYKIAGIDGALDLMAICTNRLE